MSTVTFLVHPERPDALALANETAEWLTGRGDSARILQFSAPDQVTESGTASHVDAVDLEGTYPSSGSTSAAWGTCLTCCPTRCVAP